MDFLINIDKISMGMPILYYTSSQVASKSWHTSVLKLVLILANSADSDKMQHYAAFLLGLHCLPKCPFKGYLYTMG